MQTRILFSLLIIFCTAANAQNLSGIPAAFVDIGVGARPAAIGGAFTALANDASAVFWNPAGLTRLENKSLLLTRADHFDIIPYNAVAVGLPLGDGNIHAFGAGLIYSGDEQMHETVLLWSYGVAVSDLVGFLPGETLLGLNFKWQSARFGNNTIDPSAYPLFDPAEIAAAQSEQVRGSASGFGFDMGLLFQPSSSLRYGLMWRNLGNTVKWDNGEEKYNEGVPGAVVLAAAFVTPGKISVSVDWERSMSGGANQLRFGSEKAFWQRIVLRGGIGQTLEAEQTRNYALGAGLMQDFGGVFSLALDYAYQMHPIANTQRLSVGLRF
jgi:long-subunit fatty acid transport protein